MVQKNIPYINKSGYSMFWNSMWDNKNNYSKFLQKDYFIKSFINYFFSDFLQNQFVFKTNFNKLDLNSIKLNYNYNFLSNNKNYLNLFLNNKINNEFFLKNVYDFNSINKNKNYLNYYLNNNFNSDIYLSKIWLFKYQNWIILYFFVFSRNNSYVLKKNTKFYTNNVYFSNYLNNFYLNLFKLNVNKKYSDSFIFSKNNF